jgi:hypothetical protein
MIAFGFTFNACWEGPKTVAKAYLFVTLEEASGELIAAWTAKHGDKCVRLSLPQVRQALEFVKGKLPVRIERRKVHPIGQRRPTYETHRICQSHEVVLLRDADHISPIARYEFGWRSFAVGAK